jgi:hypothetical protein
MAKKPSRKLVDRATRKSLLEEIGNLERVLCDNPWWRPLFAAQTIENTCVDAARTATFEWQKENQDRWMVWRHFVRLRLDECRRFVNDTDFEQIPRFDNNQLWRMAHLPDSIEGFLERKSYLKQHCVADLQSIAGIVRSIGRSSSRKPRPPQRSKFCKDLERARGGDTQEQAADAIYKLLQERGSERDPITQSEYSQWESGRRKPRAANLEACRAYIEQRLNPSSVQ